MTLQKLRHPNTWDNAAVQVAGALGWDGAAEAVGKSAALVRVWADPDKDSLPNVEQAVALDAAYEASGAGPGPLLAAYKERLRQAVARLGGAPPHTPADSRDRLAVVMTEAGELAGEVRAALADGRVTPNEASRVAGEAADCIAALRALIADMEAICRGGAA